MAEARIISTGDHMPELMDASNVATTATAARRSRGVPSHYHGLSFRSNLIRAQHAQVPGRPIDLASLGNAQPSNIGIVDLPPSSQITSVQLSPSAEDSEKAIPVGPVDQGQVNSPMPAAASTVKKTKSEAPPPPVDPFIGIEGDWDAQPLVASFFADGTVTGPDGTPIVLPKKIAEAIHQNPLTANLATAPSESPSFTAASAVATVAMPPSAAQAPSSAVSAIFSRPSRIVAAPTTAATGADGSKPMSLADFPRPEADNGRGMHWVPTLNSTKDVVDRFVKEAKDMKVKWMTILNDDAKIGTNDYLVKQLVAKGIMPVMRVYTPRGRPIQGDLTALVKHYKALGVSYYQLYNEPNLNDENPDGVPNVDKYLDKWLPAAKAVTSAGGLPGIGALAPGGNYDDMKFLNEMFDKLKQRGEAKSLDNAWLSLHNYTLNHPLDYTKDSNGFLKFKWYDAVVKNKLGREMPIIGTEGGTQIGSADDKTMAPIDQAKQIDMVTGAYRYMENREPYNFAYSYWVIANEAGGGRDTAFTKQALFTKSGPSPLVNALKQLA